MTDSPTETLAPPAPPIDQITETVSEEGGEPLRVIPEANVIRIRELLDVLPATDAAIAGQIRALLPSL